MSDPKRASDTSHAGNSKTEADNFLKAEGMLKSLAFHDTGGLTTSVVEDRASEARFGHPVASKRSWMRSQARAGTTSETWDTTRAHLRGMGKDFR